MSKPWETPGSGELILLVDADILCHAAACAADGRTYRVGLTTFKYKKEAQVYCAEHGIDEKNIVLTYEPEPLSHALQILKQSIEKLSHKFPGAKHEMFLTGKTNFRDEVFSTYKGNRTEMRRPEHLSACQNYMRDKHSAHTSHDCEADDMIAIAAHEMKEGYVVCTLDKDLDMIPGKHYNWRKNKEYTTTPRESQAIFYRQLLTGDKVDNIPGLYGIGPAKAKRLIPDDTLSDYVMYKIVLDTYIEHDPMEDDEIDREYFLRKIKEVSRNARLLWLQTEEGQVWQPPSKDIGSE